MSAWLEPVIYGALAILQALVGFVVKSQRDDIARLTTKVDDHATRIASVEAKHEGFGDRLTSLEQRIDRVSDKVDEVPERVARLMGKVIG